MVQAAAAGILPLDFYALTLGEIAVAIDGYRERERVSLIGRVSAICRALSKGDPLQDLRSTGKQVRLSLKQAAQRFLWSE